MRVSLATMIFAFLKTQFNQLAMATLVQKWEAIEKSINHEHEGWLSQFFKDKERPTVVYQLQGWQSITEQPITSWGLSDTSNWRPNYYKKPTKKDLERLIEWHLKFAPSEDKIFLYYEYASGWGGKVSGAHNLVKIRDDKNISFNKEDLIPRLNELQAIYAPREGHMACTYCRRQTVIETMIDYTVIARQYPGMKKTSKYCSVTCGANDQMAHEG